KQLNPNLYVIAAVNGNSTGQPPLEVAQQNLANNPTPTTRGMDYPKQCELKIDCMIEYLNSRYVHIRESSMEDVHLPSKLVFNIGHKNWYYPMRTLK
ncbi:hypothetical protein H5410_027274, partial [Solanum commersonii]